MKGNSKILLVKKGDRVAVDYEGKFEDGAVFDTSKHGEHSHPLEFVVGANQVVAGFDNAMVGMEEGQSKEITIWPEEAYGKRDERLQQTVPVSTIGGLPQGQKLEAGMQLVIRNSKNIFLGSYER